jgi:hypothetical protein
MYLASISYIFVFLDNFDFKMIRGQHTRLNIFRVSASCEFQRQFLHRLRAVNELISILIDQLLIKSVNKHKYLSSQPGTQSTQTQTNYVKRHEEGGGGYGADIQVCRGAGWGIGESIFLFVVFWVWGAEGGGGK